MIIKLRRRLIAAIMAFAAMITLATFAAIYMMTFVRIANENTEKLNSEEQIILVANGNNEKLGGEGQAALMPDNQMILNGQQLTISYTVNRVSPDLGVHFTMLADESGRLLFIDSALNLRIEEYEEAAALAIRQNKRQGSAAAELAGRSWLYKVEDEYENKVLFSSSALAPSGSIRAIRFLDITDSRKTLETLMVTLAGLYGVLMVIFFMLACFAASRSLRPMIEAWEGQRRFIADASHELKTPIATLNANLDILYVSQEETVREQIKWIDNSKKVLSRMTVLIQSMLELAKVEEPMYTYHAEKVCINELLEEAWDSCAARADQKRITAIEPAGTRVQVMSSYSLMQQITEILLDNAVRYTNTGGEIRMNVLAERSGVVIEIQNTGDGIPLAEINRVFDRFYRGDKAREWIEGNYGLGLAIAKSAVQKLGGTISAESNSSYTKFTVKIPDRKHP